MTLKNSIAKDFVDKLLEGSGEDMNRDGLQETPERVLKMYKELLSGYQMDPKEVFKVFESHGYKDLVTVTNIDFYSLCEHHMIPFFGKVHVGYIPNGKILGLSKFARLVDIYARRLQTQEHMTRQIHEAIVKHLNPDACIVHLEAEHLCVSMRGIKKKGFVTETTVKDEYMKKNVDVVDQFYKEISS